MTRIRSRGRGLAALVGIGALALLGPSCASSSGKPTAASKPSDKASDKGFRVLTAVVTEREYDAPGSTGGGGYGSSGSYYLSFEAEDGDKTVHYRFPVTRQQYFRNPEGTRVQITLAGNDLRDIRPAKE
jgi:hypothetical protein